MNKFSNYKISFRSPYITIFDKIIYICVANIVPISNLGVQRGLIAIFYKFSETAKSAGEMTDKKTIIESVAFATDSIITLFCML